MTWLTKKLGEIAEISSGGTPRTGVKDYWNGNVPWLRSGELIDKEIYKTEKLITKKGLEESSAKLFPKNSVLIALTGATVGRTGILRITSATNQSVVAIFPNEKYFVPEFVWYFLRLNYQKIKARAYGGAQSHIDQGDIKAMKIPLPPLKIQKQIVERLDKIAEAQKLNDELIQKSDELFQSFLHKEIQSPKGWETKKLEEIVDINYGKGLEKSYRKENGKYYAYGSNGPVYRTDKILIEELTIIVGRKGGAGLLWMTEEPSWPIDTTFYLRVKDRSNTDLNFIYFSLQTKNLPKFAIVTAVPGINRSTLYNVKILFPPLKIQKQIVEKLSVVQDYKKKLLEQKQKLQELFESVLNKSMKRELVK